MLSQLLTLTRLYLFSPTKGAEAARKEENFIPSLWLYVLCISGYMFLYWLKPFDFPDRNAAFPQESLDLFFWFKAIMLWQPPLEAAWIVFLVGLVMWFKEGSFVFKFVTGIAWTAAPVILIVAYQPNQPYWPYLHYPSFALGSAIWVALFYPLVRKAPAQDWKPLIAFMMGVNVIGFVLVIPMETVVLLHQYTSFSQIELRIGETILNDGSLFNGLQLTMGLWILNSSMRGLRALTGLRLPRAFLAVVFSLCFQMAIAFTLYMLKLVPWEILKALIYA